jgi:hypothetical protein
LIRLGLGGPDAQDLVAINVASAGLILLTGLIVRLNGYSLGMRGRST